LLIFVLGVIRRVNLLVTLSKAIIDLFWCGWLLLSRLDVQLAALEESFVELCERGNCALLLHIPHEANAQRHSLAMLAKWNLNVYNFSVLAK